MSIDRLMVNWSPCTRGGRLEGVHWVPCWPLGAGRRLHEVGALVMLAPLALVKGSVLEQAGMGRSAWGLTSSSCFADRSSQSSREVVLKTPNNSESNLRIVSR